MGRITVSTIVVALGRWICCTTEVLNSAVASGGPIACDLELKYGSRSEGPPGQFHLNLVVVNVDDITNTACRVAGYPDVELIGPADPDFGTIYFIPPSAGHTETVTLRTGKSAHADLTWLPPSRGVGNR